MKWFPSSLRGRTLLLMITAIIACQGLTLVVLGIYRHNFLGSRGRDYMASHVLLVREALRHSPPEEVAHNLENAPGRRMRLIAMPPPSASAEPPPLEVYPTRMVEALREDYGPDAVRFTTSPIVALWVQVEPGGWWLMIPSSRFEVPIPWPTVIATIGAVGLMAIVVGFYVLHLSRPLRTLAEAAGQFEVGKRPQLPLSGPDEVRSVTAQFNAMADRLAQNEAERHVMLAGLPHDLRAPLARAKLRLALMEDGDRSGFERDLGEIEQIANQFVAYLRGLDHDTSRFTPLNLAHLLEDRGRAWQGAGQDVAAERIDPVDVQGDKSALERAIDNLISNAFAHGKAPVLIRGIASEGAYRIEVEDRGPGIPEELRLEAMQPFVRLDSSRGAGNRVPGETGRPAQTGGHCGLGLAVVQAVSRLHGGRVALNNAPSGGLIAAIVLPIAPLRGLATAA
ncbi:MAG: ATP-binding protein [Burkholderiaceae bacterium]|jgi:two-component system osmolarity sensor histidine kinase EnvZ